VAVVGVARPDLQGGRRAATRKYRNETEVDAVCIGVDVEVLAVGEQDVAARRDLNDIRRAQGEVMVELAANGAYGLPLSEQCGPAAATCLR
jgi:hypothetical protein